MNDLEQSMIVICSIDIAVILFYSAYCICSRYGDSDPDTLDLEPTSSSVFKEMFLFIQMQFYHQKIIWQHIDILQV